MVGSARINTSLAESRVRLPAPPDARVNPALPVILPEFWISPPLRLKLPADRVSPVPIVTSSSNTASPSASMVRAVELFVIISRSLLSVVPRIAVVPNAFPF